MFRNTYAEINLKNIKDNIKKVIQEHGEYQYYFGIVKAGCYGHKGIRVVEAILDAGCNYLGVATLDEALEIRRFFETPILCLGIVPIEYVEIAHKNDITLTVSSLQYLRQLVKLDKPFKIHFKLNTGMNRLGVNTKEELNMMYELVKNSKILLEGIYTHIHSPLLEGVTIKQFKKFEELTSDIDLKTIPIVHLCASDALVAFPKPDYVNGCRLGIIMYGFNNVKKDLKSTFKLKSEIIQINEVYKDETVGYIGAYKAEEFERIGIVPIGYADGIIRKNTGRDVYINNKRYKIVGNICMDMLFVKIDDTVKVGDEVEIIRDNEHLREIAKHLDTLPYEIICSIGSRVQRVYK